MNITHRIVGFVTGSMAFCQPAKPFVRHAGLLIFGSCLFWQLFGNSLPAQAETNLLSGFKNIFMTLEQEQSPDAVLDRSKWPKHDLLASYVELELLFHPYMRSSEEDLQRFLTRWPNHAQVDRVQRLLEQRYLVLGGESEFRWYEQHPPTNFLARSHYVQGLLQRNLLDSAYVWWRDLYRAGADLEPYQLAKDHPFWSKLVQGDHESRVRSLLGKESSAFTKVLNLLPVARQDFFLAMNSAQKGDAQFLPLIRKLTLTVTESQELWQVHFETLRRLGRRSHMVQLLEGSVGQQLSPSQRQRWRYYLGRALLFIEEDFKSAYRLLKENVREKGGRLEDSLWMAAWSLYRDGERAVAGTLFEKLAKEGQSSFRRSQGAYWAARMSQSDQQKKQWLAVAAKNQDNLYGLLATEEGEGSLSFLKSDPLPCLQVQGVGKLSAQDVEGLKWLQLVGRDWYNGFEIKKLGNRFGLLPEEQLCLAIQYGAADLAIKLASELQVRNKVYWRGLFPLPEWEPDGGWVLSPALVWGTSRQESHFFHRAESSAKALGIMQLMPATARMEAKLSKFLPATRLRLQLPHYNLAVGQAYMQRMLKQFDGDLVLALAAYNAGPSRSKSWQADRKKEDALTFIENIPITETRNYVKRVLAGMVIYRLQMDEKVSMKASMATGGPGLLALSPTVQIQNSQN